MIRLCLLLGLALAMAMPRAAWASHQIGHAPVALTDVHAVDGHGHAHGHEHGPAAQSDDDRNSSDDDDQAPEHTHLNLASQAAFGLPPVGHPQLVTIDESLLLVSLDDVGLTSAEFPLQERPPRFV